MAFETGTPRKGTPYRPQNKGPLKTGPYKAPIFKPPETGPHRHPIYTPAQGAMHTPPHHPGAMDTERIKRTEQDTRGQERARAKREEQREAMRDKGHRGKATGQGQGARAMGTKALSKVRTQKDF